MESDPAYTFISMAFGFPASHTEEFVVPTIDLQYRAHVRAKLNQLGWSFENQGYDKVVMGTHAGLASWGEVVTCEFLSEGQMRVTSKCKLPTQCFDYGKNKRNVQTVRTTLGL